MSADQLQEAAHVEPAIGMDVKPPPLVALFLIKFDVKVGYTISWKQSSTGVPLEGVVEYKSLPSGLHNVQEDLVYFHHETYAGVSAFVKGQASEAERNAHFVAVGAMLRLKDGRLGRAWLHARNLQILARAIVNDTSKVEPLQEYWEEHRAPADEEDFSSPQLSPFTLAQRKSRAMSSATLSGDSRQTLPAFHPALGILDYIDFFGPLIFPLHRAALLRQRILFVTSPPIRQACEFVYDLSIFTTTPLSLANSLVLPSDSLVRLRPMFAVGIHDIPLLEKLSSPAQTQPTSSSNSHLEREMEAETQDEEQVGWIACTTDEILVMKTKLYDIVVEFPETHAAQDGRKKKQFPVIKSAADGKQIKATQRDLRKFRLLARALRPIKELELERTSQDLDHSEVDPLMKSSMPGQFDEEFQDDGDIVEATTWSELAYSSFIWWASAGEKDESMVEEEKLDSSLLGDLQEIAEQVADERRYKDDETDDPESTLVQSTSNVDTEPRKDARIDMAVISYFHKLTRTIFEVASDIVQASDTEANDEGNVQHIDREELRTMGLDVWSTSDREFVRCLYELWFQRRVHVNPLGIECCGVKIC